MFAEQENHTRLLAIVSTLLDYKIRVVLFDKWWPLASGVRLDSVFHSKIDRSRSWWTVWASKDFSISLASRVSIDQFHPTPEDEFTTLVCVICTVKVSNISQLREGMWLQNVNFLETVYIVTKRVQYLQVNNRISTDTPQSTGVTNNVIKPSIARWMMAVHRCY